MEFHNSEKGRFILDIQLLSDMSCQELTILVDDKVYSLPLSNEGYYAFPLGQFSKCVVNEENLKLTLKKSNPFFEEVLQNYRQTILDSISDIKVDKDNLWIGLPKEKTEALYGTFKRLLVLTKKSIIESNSVLKKWVIDILTELILKEYNGKENYQGNWWIYEIGIPRTLNEILILLYDELSKEKIFEYMAIENFYIPQAKYTYYRRNYPLNEKKETDYANLSDTIYICLLRSILLQNVDQMKELYSLLPSILQIVEKGNGFYKDGSFIYHNSIPYNASYGEVLLYSLSKILELYVRLGYDCTDYFERLYALIDKAYIPFLYHQRALDCVRGRAISRRTDCHYSFQTIMGSFHRLARFYSKQGFLDRIYNEDSFFFYKPEVFVFNYMDRYIKRNNDYLIAISAHSSKVADYESINEENLLGYYQANFTYDLYFNEAPLKNEILKIHPFYRNGSTNVLEIEKPNQVMNNPITAGVSLNGILNVCCHQKNEVQGYFTKLVLPHSLLAIGTRIASQKPYVSTVYNFSGGYYYSKGYLETENCRIYTRDKPVIEEVMESRSFYELNHNESDEVHSFKINRIYYQNVESYLYQIYPKSRNIKDEYRLEETENAHIIQYKDMIIMNVFTDDRLKYKEFTIQGRVALIASKTEAMITICLATDVVGEVMLKIKNFSCEELKSDRIWIEDELEHTFVFRRDL